MATTAKACRCGGIIKDGKCNRCGVGSEGRPNSHQRGYSTKWRTLSQQFLRENPLCEACAVHGKVTVATVVDHQIPHRGDQGLFWRRSNWAALCERCHNAKSGRGE